MTIISAQGYHNVSQMLKFIDEQIKLYASDDDREALVDMLHQRKLLQRLLDAN